MPNLDDAGVQDIFDRVQSHAMQLDRFERVNMHEPKNAPGTGLTCAIWVDYFGPALSSGLSATTAILRLMVRVYQNFRQDPLDMIDPSTLAAINSLMGAYTGDFDLGGTVRSIDLLGMAGIPLQAQAGYVPIDNKVYRVMTITLPIIINDAWAQAG